MLERTRSVTGDWNTLIPSPAAARAAHAIINMHRISHRTSSRVRRRRRQPQPLPQATRRSRRRRRVSRKANTEARLSRGDERSPSNEEKRAVTFPGVVVTQVEVARAYSAAPRRTATSFEGKVSNLSFLDDDNALCPSHVSTVSSRLPPPPGENRGGASTAGKATKDIVIVAASTEFSMSRCTSSSRGHSGHLLSTFGNCNVRDCISFGIDFERLILQPFFARTMFHWRKAQSVLRFYVRL